MANHNSLRYSNEPIRYQCYLWLAKGRENGWARTTQDTILGGWTPDWLRRNFSANRRALKSVALTRLLSTINWQSLIFVPRLAGLVANYLITQSDQSTKQEMAILTRYQKVTKRKRQKAMGLQVKQQLFCTFVYCHCTTSTWKCLISWIRKRNLRNSTPGEFAYIWKS